MRPSTFVIVFLLKGLHLVWGLPSILNQPSPQQLWPAFLSLLSRASLKHDVAISLFSPWGWYAVEYWFYTIHTVENLARKINFWSPKYFVSYVFSINYMACSNLQTELSLIFFLHWLFYFATLLQMQDLWSVQQLVYQSEICPMISLSAEAPLESLMASS